MSVGLVISAYIVSLVFIFSVISAIGSFFFHMKEERPESYDRFLKWMRKSKENNNSFLGSTLLFFWSGFFNMVRPSSDYYSSYHHDYYSSYHHDTFHEFYLVYFVLYPFTVPITVLFILASLIFTSIYRLIIKPFSEFLDEKNKKTVLFFFPEEKINEETKKPPKKKAAKKSPKKKTAKKSAKKTAVRKAKVKKVNVL